MILGVFRQSVMAFSWFAVSCVAATIALTVGFRDYCTALNGDRKELYVEWDEGVKSCQCMIPETLAIFWDGSNPSDAINHCLFNGCPTDEFNTKVVKAGEKFQLGEEDCICRDSSTSSLADAHMLYYAVCRKTNGISRDVYFDW